MYIKYRLSDAIGSADSCKSGGVILGYHRSGTLNSECSVECYMCVPFRGVKVNRWC